MANKDMDMEKGMQQAMGGGAASDAQVPPMTGKGEKEPLLPNLHVQPVEGGVVVAGKMKPGLKKWRLPFWLLVGSMIVVTNSIHPGPKYKMIIPPEVAAMVVFLCAICFIFATMLTC